MAILENILYLYLAIGLAKSMLALAEVHVAAYTAHRVNGKPVWLLMLGFAGGVLLTTLLIWPRALKEEGWRSSYVFPLQRDASGSVRVSRSRQAIHGEEVHMNIPSIYWRLRIENEAAFRDMVSSSTAICPDTDFLLKVSRGHGICLASYDHATACGTVRALGIVTGSDPTNSRLRVTWQETNITLKPRGQGQRYWTDRPYFGFAKTVVDRYMLAALFAENFPELGQDAGTREVSDAATGSGTARRLAMDSGENGGFVYLIKSPYGYKIGKSKNMKQRSQLFSVKLPFPIEIVHFGWFADYSAAEARYHRTYAHKRLEGEWFNLNEGDISAITREMKK